MKSLHLFVLFSFLLFNINCMAGKYNLIISVGDDMPSFTKLPGIDGTQLSSSDVLEDVVVIVLLANHCPWVRGMDQDLINLVNDQKEKSVKIIGLSVNHREYDRLPAMQQHAQKVGYNFTYLFDESQQLGRDLGATRTPEYFVFNKERKLVYMGLLYNSPAKMNLDGSIHHINGDVTEFYVSTAITKTLTGEILDVSETRAHGCSVKYEN